MENKTVKAEQTAILTPLTNKYMHVERHKNTTVPDWYMARLRFKTKHGTIAQASGYGRSFSEAIVDCFRDYKIINSL